MRSYTLTCLLLFLGSTLLAQPRALQKLTLEDAIMKGRSTLGAERISGLQWMPNTDGLVHYSKDGKQLKTIALKSDQSTSALDLKALNKALDLELKRLPRVHWDNTYDIHFTHKNSIYQYNTNLKKGKQLLSFPDNIGNSDYHLASNQLAYTIDNNLYIASASKESIPVTEIEDKNIVSGQAIARYEFGIGGGTFWSPNGTLLAFYQKDETDVADYPLLDITTTPGTLRSVKYPMAGQKSEYAKVGVFNAKTNKTTYLKVDGDKEQYLTNLSWDTDNKHLYIAVINRDQNHMWYNKYDATTGTFVKTLFEETHPKYVEPLNAAWPMPNSNNEFLWLSRRDGYTHAYRYNTDGKLLGQITKGKWEVTSILGLDHTGKNLIVQGTDESGINQYAYAVNLKSGKSNRLSKEDGMHYYSLSSDGKYLTDNYTNLKTPSKVDIISTEGKVIKNVLTSKNPLAGHKVGTTELVELKSDAGDVLHARMIKPSDFTPKNKYPVLVYVYGGPHAQMVTNRWLAGAPLWMHYMAEKGYIIFTLDNRGSKSRGADFENIIHRNLGDIEIKDQLVGVNYLKSLPYVDGERMAVHGWSYGGFMTTSLMLREPGTFQVGVAGGPVTDWKYYEIMYGERYMDRPEENPEGYKKSALVNYAKDLEGDLLLIHGTVDDVVVMQHNLALVQKFVEEGILIDFFPYPMHPHNVRGKDRIHLMNKVLTYIEDKLSKN